jgi:hypothetical protein
MALSYRLVQINVQHAMLPSMLGYRYGQRVPAIIRLISQVLLTGTVGPPIRRFPGPTLIEAGCHAGT